ncbi:hypothetical protein B0H14DRAFT_3625341 [Mycena olivaceomarginata]|nr:hypothetical protein B0H14DRAFT_3625341 [Mycena olivaceomarginata]
MRPGAFAPHFKQFPVHFEPAPTLNGHPHFDRPHAHFERPSLRRPWSLPRLCDPATKDGVNPTLGYTRRRRQEQHRRQRPHQAPLAVPPYGSSMHQLIQRASGVVAFEIVVASSFSSFSNTSTTSTIDAGRSGNTAAPEPLAFPATLHKDQFLDGNLDLANKTRAAEGVVRREMGMLASRRGVLVGFEGQDTLGNLRGAIEYYEHVAACDSPERFATLRRMAGKLGISPSNCLISIHAVVDVIPRAALVIADSTARTSASLASLWWDHCAHSIIHALFHVPKSASGSPNSTSTSSTARRRALGALRAHRDFTALGIGRMNVYLDEELLSAWEAPHLGAGDEVGQAMPSVSLLIV